MTKFELVWSADAIREAFDATEAQQVGFYFLSSEGLLGRSMWIFPLLLYRERYVLAAMRGEVTEL